MQNVQVKKIQFLCQKEQLIGNIWFHDSSDELRILFLHGAGNATKDRIKYLAESLAKHLIASLSFDFSGCGESSGDIKQSSLRKRTLEAEKALDFFKSQFPVTVCASSMGAHIALELLNTQRVKNLILFCPAIYDRAAFSVPFTRQFSEIIRKKDSWKKSDVFSLLEKFKGKLLIYIGKNDEIIPPEVVVELNVHANLVSRKEIITIPQATHAIHSYISSHPSIKEIIVNKIIEFSK